MSYTLLTLPEKIGEHCLRKGWTLAIAESCTGGLVSAAITEISGSSQWFDCGFVTYTNQAKIDMLGVPEATLADDGAVSELAVRAMAEGALRHSLAQVSVAVSGIAGPTGGTPGKPVGLVWFAYACLVPELTIQTKQMHFSGNRQQIRSLAVEQALNDLLQFISNDAGDPSLRSG